MRYPALYISSILKGALIMSEQAEKKVDTESVSETECEMNPGAVTVDEAQLEKTIRSHVYMAMGLGIVPFSFFNAATVTAVQLKLVRDLSGQYGVSFKEGAARKIIAAVAGAGVSTLATPLVESIVGGIPIIGLPLVIGTKPVLNGLTTYAVGRMFITHFERGGTFMSANFDALKEDFKSAFQNSREWLGNTISGKKDEKSESAAV